MKTPHIILQSFSQLYPIIHLSMCHATYPLLLPLSCSPSLAPPLFLPSPAPLTVPPFQLLLSCSPSSAHPLLFTSPAPRLLLPITSSPSPAPHTCSHSPSPPLQLPLTSSPLLFPHLYWYWNKTYYIYIPHLKLICRVYYFACFSITKKPLCYSTRCSYLISWMSVLTI